MSIMEREGVSTVQLIVSQKLGWIFREQPIEDYGIDAHIEVRGKSYPTGKLIGVQIKSGKSYFKECDKENVIFRFDEQHCKYWLGCTFNVILAIYSPETHECIWEEIGQENISKTASGNYSIKINRKNLLCKESKNKLILIAYQGNIKEIAYSVEELFSDPAEICSFYNDLSKTGKDIFRDGICEFSSKNISTCGIPLPLSDDSLPFLRNAFSAIHVEPPVPNADGEICKSFTHTYSLIQDYILSNTIEPLLIIGEPGIGKSYLSQKIFQDYQHISIYLQGKNSQYFDYNMLNKICSQSAKIILLLDGLDEISPGNKTSIQQFLLKMKQYPQVKLIITSRYIADYPFAHTTIHLAPFSKDDIIDYLKEKGISDDIESFRYLSLFNTPALLNLLIQFMKDNNMCANEITEENILMLYYQRCPKGKLNRLKNLAFEMYLKGSFQLSISQFNCSHYFDLPEVIIAGDTIQFSHKFFYDFYLSVKIFEDIFIITTPNMAERIAYLFSHNTPSIEVFLLVKTLIKMAAFETLKLHNISSDLTAILSNVCPIYSIAKHQDFNTISNIFYTTWHILLYIKKLTAGTFCISSSDNFLNVLPHYINIFNRCHFSKKYLDFSDVIIENLQLWRCNVINMNFKSAVLHHANFKASSLHGSTFENADLTHSNFVYADLRHTCLRNTKFEDCNVSHCIISQDSLPDILKYKHSLKGLKSLVIKLENGEYMTYSQYSKL